ncbi:hypothetical protein [Desulfomicrobium baculatum]|uniref:Iron-sulfur cluster-binding protein n=1 Tax=Desulfomicrobium baculatum (strain DSM 4028 / VKM B-1378 / X) TaxID=525897 RepID=C7LSR6_DESBD|nr:hypothetical protein [Desulfomicrobium baculatum]ACU89457.1 iron-sulfur cluster-binding protein [Desulfomicrobium baculatum DSM 4028]
MNSRTLVFRLTVFALAFTGFAQMPIFARYYLADVPGFGWTADYYFNHVAHYILAIVLLAILGWRLPRVLRRPAWTAMDVIVGLCWAGIVLTGIVRVMKNQPESYFSPTLVMWVDWLHLGFVMLLGAASLMRSRVRVRTVKSH